MLKIENETPKMKNLRNESSDFFINKEFKLIKEISLVETSNGNDFNTSLLIAHLNTILNSEKDKLFSIQRVFYPSKHDEIQRLPLFSFFQVMCSFYYKNIKDIQEPLNISVDFLKNIVNVDWNKVKIMINEDTFERYKCQWLSHFNTQQIWITNKRNTYDFKYNDEVNVQGEYVKFFLEYKNGIFPIFDFVLMEYAQTLCIEAGVILERCLFVKEKVNTIFDTEIYTNLNKKISKLYGEHIFRPEYDYLGYYISHMIRSLSIVMLDGLKPSSRSPRTKTLRYWMKYLMVRVSLYNLSPSSLILLLDSCFESLKLSGYNYKLQAYVRVQEHWINEIKQLHLKLPDILTNIFSNKNVSKDSIYNEVLKNINHEDQIKKIKNNIKFSHGYTFDNELKKMRIINNTHDFYSNFVD